MTHTDDPATNREDGSGTIVGRFTYHPERHRWLWSPEVYRIHGYPPGGVIPTTDLILEHVHAPDRERVARVLRMLLDDGEQFACPHTMVDARGRHRQVVAVGVGVRRDDAVVHRSGFLVDLTEARDAEIRREVDGHLREIVASRSVIDQARGVLMAVHRIDANTAWELLRTTSQHTNVKVREIATRLLGALPAGDADPAAIRATVAAIVPASGPAVPDHAVADSAVSDHAEPGPAEPEHAEPEHAVPGPTVSSPAAARPRATNGER